jgi:PAS domain S-box-containing protein
MKFLPPLKIGVPIAVLLFGFISSAVSFFYEQRTENRMIEERFRERTRYLGTQVAALSANLIENNARDAAQREVALAAASPDVRLIHVLDASDVVLFSSRYESIGRPFPETRSGADRPSLAQARQSGQGVTGLRDQSDTITGAFPFPITTSAGELTSKTQGVVFLELDLSFAKATARYNDLRRMRLGLAVLLGLCALFVLLFHQSFTSRVHRLIDAARRLATGDLSARTALTGSDELARIGQVFDEMSAQLQRRDAALIESEHRFRQMAENIGEIFWLYDFGESRILFANAAFEQIFGRSVQALLENSAVWHNAIHPEDREWVLAEFRREREGPREIKYRILHADGTVRWLRDRSFPILEPDGRVPRVAGIAADITAQRQATEEQSAFDRRLQETQRLESLGVLAGGIAHDFNNLLTGVLGNASLARMAVPYNADAQRYLGEIEAVAIRAADLCKQMLAYSGKGRFEVQRLDLSDLVQETAKLLNLSIAKNAVLRFALATGLPPIVADATQLRQVVMNLVINASEALEGKSGTISLHTGVIRVDRQYLQTVALAEQVEPGNYVFLEVADSGCGMDAATLSRIFEPFFTTKFTGRGLGLSAVLGIVRGHKGALKAASEPGKGTMFKLLFPVAEGQAQPLHAEKLTPATWYGTGNVLVVDDEETVRAVTARMLENFGFTPILASDGTEAVRIFGAAPSEFVAVLMDLTMPNMDGEETFRRLRHLAPGVRVILMSGFNEQEALGRFTGKGLAGFLQKPFRPDQLRTRMQQLLQGAKL